MTPNLHAPLEIPERYEDVTAEWLTQALRAGGVLGEQSVSSFAVEPIDAARSRLSSLAKILVEYDSHAERAPNSIFAKFVSRIPANRERAKERDLFRTEIALYQHLGGSISLNMPSMYFGGAQEGSDVAVLLLEEIKGVSKAGLPLDEEWSLTKFEALLALRELSKLHARWWQDSALDEHSWLIRVDSDRLRNSYKAYEGAWAKSRDVLAPALDPVEVRICDGLADFLPKLLPELDRLPITLCHGDYHVGNLLWDKLGEPETVWAVDWQVSFAGPAIIDVAWLLGVAVPTDEQKLIRETYLPEYHRALLDGGVADYEYERFLSDFRFGLLNLLQHLVVVSSVVDYARDDALELVRMVVGRTSAAAEDAGCGELLL